MIREIGVICVIILLGLIIRSYLCYFCDGGITAGPMGEAGNERGEAASSRVSRAARITRNIRNLYYF